jgi:hypothetical protein
MAVVVGGVVGYDGVMLYACVCMIVMRWKHAVKSVVR